MLTAHDLINVTTLDSDDSVAQVSPTGVARCCPSSFCFQGFNQVKVSCLLQAALDDK